MATRKASPVPAERIERAIRSCAATRSCSIPIWRPSTKWKRVLVQAVKRNLKRFPQDFMFQLGTDEVDRLRSQSVISNAPGRGGRRYAPYAFTEQGVAMLSTVLNPTRHCREYRDHARLRALRMLLASNKELARRDRCSIQAGLRSDPALDDITRSAETAHRICHTSAQTR